jgi:tetratricopeptide (TPR) repeat protein
VEPSSDLSIDEAVGVYRRWFRSAPRGFALLVYRGDPARREFLDKLGGKVAPVRFVDLSRGKDAQSVVESMASALLESDSVVFSGFEEALAPSPENAKLLNYNRERLAKFGARQLWVIGPIWRRALLTWAYDLYSWFLPNNLVGSARPGQDSIEVRQLETVGRQAAGPLPSQSARRSAKNLLARFERSYAQGSVVSWDLMNAALESLGSAGAYAETHDLLSLARGLIAEVCRSGGAESPQALRDLSISLDNVGGVQSDLGRRDEALASYDESLGIRRRLLDSYGESPQALRDLSVSLDNVGKVQSDLGRRDEALASYEESLGIRRRLLDSYGESPQALRDLSVSLNNVGGVQRDLGRRDEALASYEESLGIGRRLLDSYGESPQALRDLSVSLDNVGGVQSDLGRRDEALASYEESLGIRRRLLDSYGESPQALRDLALSSGRIARVKGVSSPDRDRAQSEAARSIERAIELYGELAELVEVRDWVKGLAAQGPTPP